MEPRDDLDVDGGRLTACGTRCSLVGNIHLSFSMGQPVFLLNLKNMLLTKSSPEIDGLKKKDPLEGPHTVLLRYVLSHCLGFPHFRGDNYLLWIRRWFDGQ